PAWRREQPLLNPMPQRPLVDSRPRLDLPNRVVLACHRSSLPCAAKGRAPAVVPHSRQQLAANLAPPPPGTRQVAAIHTDPPPETRQLAAILAGHPPKNTAIAAKASGSPAHLPSMGRPGARYCRVPRGRWRQLRAGHPPFRRHLPSNGRVTRLENATSCRDWHYEWPRAQPVLNPRCSWDLPPRVGPTNGHEHNPY